MNRKLLIQTLLCFGLALTVGVTGCDSSSGDGDTGGGTTDDGTTGDGSTDDATAPQPLGRDARPALGNQIDRAGRAAINTALNETFNGDTTVKEAAKDAYNAAGPTDWGSYAAPFAASLAILDSLDATCGNQLIADDANADGRYAALAGILADDQLYVHTDVGECGTYLGLEAEIVGALGAGEGGCGGRMLGDDVIERSYSVLAAGILAGVDDGVTADDGAHSAEFPFLAEASGE